MSGGCSAATAGTHATPLLVLFGSNLGTAEGIAHRIADDARSRGFAAAVGPLDEHADALPRQGAVVIVTASYNGQPPDNAAKFCQKLCDPALPPDAFAGVEYSVFGCGNRDWSATYQAIPTSSTPSSRNMAGSAFTRVAKATRAATSTATIAGGTASCFPRSPRRSTCRRQRPKRKWLRRASRSASSTGWRRARSCVLTAPLP
jgi:sulfite reductase alpha subunit-like flavoprotein